MVKISVIMPVYNGERYIKETIESVLTQSYTDFEFIIIDDGSTDGTLDILKKINDNRIKVLNQNHGGIVKALNLGIKESTGEYIIRIDADDICILNRFEVLVNYMDKNPQVSVCGSWASTIDEKGEFIGQLKHPPINNQDIKKYSLLHNPFIHPSVIIRKSVIDSVGFYKNFKHNEDYELWTRVLRVGKVHNIPEFLINYRIHQNQITRKSNLKMRAVGVWVRVLAVTRLLF